MLLIYGTLLPARILEEIRFWKQQEMEHTEFIQTVVPALEQPYVRLFNEWHVVFAETERAADALLRQILEHGASVPAHLISQVEQLLRVSFDQSQHFIRQLHDLRNASPAVRQAPLADKVLLHIIRESEYFLRVLEPLNAPGALERWMASAKSEQTLHPPRAEIQVPQAAQDAAPHPSDTLEAGITSAAEGTGSNAPAAATSAATEPAKAAATADARAEGEAEAEARAASDHAPGGNGPGSVYGPAGSKPVPIGGHKLPPLPYPYNALEPHIDEATMRLHHDAHHQSYVDGLNNAENKLEEARKTGNFELVKHWERELAFHGAGHYLHTIFWSIMNPKGGGAPTGELAQQINQDFGSFERFKKHFTEAADKVEGSGWAILVWSPRSHRLEILQAEKHQNLSQWDVVPLLALDVWEHAYYLKYQNKRADYIRNWWNVVYWPEVAERFRHARTLKWPPF